MPESLPLRRERLNRVPADADFTCDPELIFEQADCVGLLNLGDEILPLDDRRFLVFSRRVLVTAPAGFPSDGRGMMWGEQIVAYSCDRDGTVHSWEHRYEVEAHSYNYALRKFRFMFANNLAWRERCEVPEPFADVR